MRLFVRAFLCLFALVCLWVILLFIPTTFWINHATSIEVSTLGPRIETSDNQTGFPIKPYGDFHVITNSKRISGSDATSISKALIGAIDPDSPGAMCHMPVYGLRFYIGPIRTFQTSICFHCFNFYDRRFLRYYWQGLSSKQDILKQLLSQVLPLQNTEQGAAANP